MSNDEFQKLVLKNLKKIDEKFDKLETKIDKLDKRFDNLEIKLDKLEAKNAERHLEIENKINMLEEVTANNWTDIIKLKKAK